MPSLLLVLLVIEKKKGTRCSCAAIAQLGECQTEDLKVHSSILGLGSRCTPALSKGLCGATLHCRFACSTMHISAAGNPTRVIRATGGYTSHYTTTEVCSHFRTDSNRCLVMYLCIV